MDKTRKILSEKNPLKKESALVVGVQKPEDDPKQVLTDLEELSQLLQTLDIQTCESHIQKRVKLSPCHLLGKGKIEELALAVRTHGAEYVVIDHPLTGSQIQNLEKSLGAKVLDRTQVILDIFAKNARSKEAKTQVEIAQLEYLLPRMVGAWTHFQKQSGASTTMRGAGEKQIEIDRRRAREKITSLQKQLEHIRKDRQTQRKLRGDTLKVSLVGYTNSGKTTLMRALTHSGAQGDQKLFATLDSSIRTLDPNTRPLILLGDTVGFIRKLPPSLIASFHSTLEDAMNADLLLHVVDISSEHFEKQVQTTCEVLKDIGADSIPTLMIFNKIDQVDDPLYAKLLKRKYGQSYVLSAHNPSDIKQLRDAIINFFLEQFLEAQLSVPYENKEALALIHRCCMILSSSYEHREAAQFRVKATHAVLSKLQSFTLTEVPHAPVSEYSTFG